MTDLAGFRTRILALLGDPSAVRYGNALLDEALSQALEQYSIAVPNLVIYDFTVSQPGREQVMDGVPAFLNVLQVVFPYRDSPSEQARLDAFYAYHNGNCLALHAGGPAVPAAGDVIRVYYTVPHTVEDLAGAAVTTANPAHDGLLCQGAAGLAALLRAAQMMENPGKRIQDVESLQKWGQEQCQRFSATLQLLANGHAHTAALPPSGWQLDRWDRGEQRQR